MCTTRPERRLPSSVDERRVPHPLFPAIPPPFPSSLLYFPLFPPYFPYISLNFPLLMSDVFHTVYFSPFSSIPLYFPSISPLFPSISLHLRHHRHRLHQRQRRPGDGGGRMLHQ